MRPLATFGVDDVRECGEVIRSLGDGVGTMEAAARRIVRYLYDELGDGRGDRACALVRLYKTHRFGALEPSLQAFARELLDDEPDPDLRCLTLLASVGDEVDWCDRRRSRAHKTIPLPTEELVERLPMVSQLIRQLGLDLSTVLRPSPEQLTELSQRTYDVFHVEDAQGSPHLPAQDEFVVPRGIASALGFGGMLYTGDLYAVVLFSRTHVPASAAQLLKILSLPVRVPLLAHLGRVFDAEPARA
jgi:hypothetical protein